MEQIFATELVQVTLRLTLEIFVLLRLLGIDSYNCSCTFIVAFEHDENLMDASGLVPMKIQEKTLWTANVNLTSYLRLV